MNKFMKWTAGLAMLSMLISAPATAATNTVQAYDDAGVKVILQFKDLKSAEWALRYIASMEAEGVFTGFEDGTFRPNESITRLQAVVTAVRLMGLEDEAKAKTNVALNFKDANKIQSWATGYVAVALEKGLFDSTENELQPNQPATRLWVATILVRAMGLENEALAKMNSTLTFTDKNAIPAGSVGYVAIAVEKGILLGYPDNTFQPQKPVTRAEMAALLDRTNEKLPVDIKEKKKQKHIEIEGVVSAISENSISVINEAGREVKVDLSNKILVFHAKGRGTYTDISVGDKIDIKYKNGRAVLIEIKNSVKTQSEKVTGTVSAITEISYVPPIITPVSNNTQSNVEEAFTGKVYKLDVNSASGPKLFYATSNTKVEIVGITNPTIQNVKVGDRVELTVFGNLALNLKVTN